MCHTPQKGEEGLHAYHPCALDQTQHRMRPPTVFLGRNPAPLTGCIGTGRPLTGFWTRLLTTALVLTDLAPTSPDSDCAAKVSCGTRVPRTKPSTTARLYRKWDASDRVLDPLTDDGSDFHRFGSQFARFRNRNQAAFTG